MWKADKCRKCLQFGYSASLPIRCLRRQWLCRYNHILDGAHGSREVWKDSGEQWDAVQRWYWYCLHVRNVRAAGGDRGGSVDAQDGGDWKQGNGIWYTIFYDFWIFLMFTKLVRGGFAVRRHPRSWYLDSLMVPLKHLRSWFLDFFFSFFNKKLIQAARRMASHPAFHHIFSPCTYIYTLPTIRYPWSTTTPLAIRSK